MKTIRASIVLLLLVVTVATPAGALLIGFEKEYAGGGAGRVLFRGAAHNQAGVTCNDCHPDAFLMLRGASDGMTMANIRNGRYCGSCHDGDRAFNANDQKNCTRCHTK